MAIGDILEVTELFGELYEPQRQFRWIMNIRGIDAFTLKTTTRPTMAFEDTVIDLINVKRYVAGKATWEPLTLTLNAPISQSAAQKVMEWVRRAFESGRGVMGYKEFYQETFSLKMLDPVGAVVEEWQIVNAWPQSFNMGELDYSVSDLVNITLTIRFDDAQLLV